MRNAIVLSVMVLCFGFLTFGCPGSEMVDIPSASTTVGGDGGMSQTTTSSQGGDSTTVSVGTGGVGGEGGAAVNSNVGGLGGAGGVGGLGGKNAGGSCSFPSDDDGCGCKK